jgi:hypothetical protein
MDMSCSTSLAVSLPINANRTGTLRDI